MAIPVEKIIVEPNGGRVVSFLGNEVTTKIEGGQTSGAFSIIEGSIRQGTSRLHIGTRRRMRSATSWKASLG